MSRRETRQGKIERLATRLCAGEVVFFIGAGFSLDSEGNTTQLLIARLLARFEALAEYAMTSMGPEAAAAARRLRTGLRTTFALESTPPKGSAFSNLLDSTKPSEDRPSVLAATLTSLTQNYYLINDWMCSAFDSLIDHLSSNAPEGIAGHVSRHENELLKQYSSSAALEPMDVEWLMKLHKHRLDYPGPPSERFVAGKALFLDTLGFNSESVMAGQPMHPELDMVADSSAGRLRMRHRVLAWLAAEGLCPTLVTTNYDLLLDCAYRLAGMLPSNPPPGLWKGPPLETAERLKLPLNRRYRHFTRVAEATQFFTHGDPHESAVIHKIHGCVETYRLFRDKDCQLFRKILPTIVFTFREIQNWREDSWSRDHLTTLMRTRTIVFAGYSGADPVIHDTFRTVYEEVAGYGERASNGAAPARDDKLPGASARAFFTDREQVGSFHGLEILRAASTAAGESSREVTEHPNLLTFFLRDARQFPTLDDLFTWMYHLAARELQLQALEAEVGRIAYQLFGKRCPDEEARAIVESFRRLRNSERAQARTFDRGSDVRWAPAVRRRFERLTAWTWVFSTALMREYRLAESLLRSPTDVFPIQDAARYPWYSPLAEHPQWAAWGAILEMAIRRAVAYYVGRPARWHHATMELEVVDHTGPAVLFRAEPGRGGGREPPVRRCLTIELATLRRLFARHEPRQLFAARTPVVWELHAETIPWWCATDNRRPAATPDARTIWQWAAFDCGAWVNADPTFFLGGSAVEQQRQSA